LETVYIIVSTPAVIPVVVPPITEAELLLLLQMPPVAGSVSTIAAPAQTDDGPEIMPAIGGAVTDTVVVDIAVPQLLVKVYVIIAVPADAPAATPVIEPMEATDGLPLIHVPPDNELMNVVSDATHIAAGPVMVPAVAVVVIVIVLVANAIPQVLFTLYEMTDVPALTPVTIPVPEPIVATNLLLLVQVPPVVVSATGNDVPTQPVEAPVIRPVPVDDFTDTVLVAKQLVEME